MMKYRISILFVLCLFTISLITLSACSLLPNLNREEHLDKPEDRNLTTNQNDIIEDKDTGDENAEDEYIEDEDAKDETHPQQEQKPTGRTSIKISVVGDIMVHMHQLKAAKQPDGNYDFTEVFEDIRPYLQEADIAMANLETTISTDEIGYTAYPRFRSPESLISALKEAGFDVITTANNHSLDGL